jgi:hypothetical protein
MPAEEPGQEFRARAQQRRSDQDRTLLAMRQLETALASAAPRREQAWRADVRAALDVLAETAASEARNAELPDSLLSDIARSQPWLRNRTRGLRLHYRQLQDTIASLRDEFSESGDAQVDFADLRQRLSSVLSGLRHQQARESDLIYEAYYDAFGSDIALDAGNPPGWPEADADGRWKTTLASVQARCPGCWAGRGRRCRTGPARRGRPGSR